MVRRASAVIAQHGLHNPDYASAAGADYLKLFSLEALGYLRAQTAEIAYRRLAHGGKRAVMIDPRFYQAKVETARFFMHRILPHTSGLFSAIMSGPGAITAFDEASF